MLLTRISIDANKPEQFETALGMVLSSPSRGKLIKIIGREFESSYSKEIQINIYSGTITRTHQTDKNYIRIYYLTSEKEEYIVVHKDKFQKILDYLN